MATSTTPTLEEVLAQADRLYSLPAVAMEVVRLTDEPKIDARALRDCIARDPALTAKLLRVVNSAVYGLRGEVGDLNQAIALLGVTPLKLLVLGFSLPDKLLEGVSSDALRRYWTETLTRASAARAIAQLGWGAGGDEAQLAALLQGVGQLVLLTQIGEPYGRVVARFEQDREWDPDDDAGSLARMEVEALGFDHRTLSAALLRKWSLPANVVDAIALQTDPPRIAASGEALPQALRLAELLVRLVGKRRLSALSALVAEGETYCGLSRKQINTLVETLQRNVEQLADAMAIELEGERDYQQTLVEAHARLAVVAEGGTRLLLGKSTGDDTGAQDDRLCDELLAEAQELSDAVRGFIDRLKGAPTDADDTGAKAAVEPGRAGPRRPHHREREGGHERLLAEANRLLADCRTQRAPLTLVLAEIDGAGLATDAPWAALRAWVQRSPWAEEATGGVWNPLSETGCAVLLPAVDRTTTTRLLNAASEAWKSERGELLDAGVASVAMVSKSFDPMTLVTAAERCLSAAQASATSTVKSIEVY